MTGIFTASSFLKISTEGQNNFLLSHGSGFLAADNEESENKYFTGLGMHRLSNGGASLQDLIVISKCIVRILAGSSHGYPYERGRLRFSPAGSLLTNSRVFPTAGKIFENSKITKIKGALLKETVPGWIGHAVL